MLKVAGDLVAQPREARLNPVGSFQSGLDMGKDVLFADVFNELGLLQEPGRLVMGSA